MAGTPTPRRIYLVRHGETAWNREMRFQGHTDTPLNERGIEQAQLLAKRMAALPHPPEFIYSSDLSRARRTAEIVGEALGVEVQTRQTLRETRLGQWEGLTRADIEARGEADLLARYIADSYRNRPPDGESLDEVFARLTAALSDLRTHHPTSNIALFGHGGSLRALLCAALEAPVSSMRRFWLDNTSLSIIEEFERESGTVSRITLVNDTSHLSRV